MKCLYCQGKMKRDKAPFHIDRKGYHLLLDAVPAWVCTQCGEVYFEAAEVDAIQRVIRSIDKQSKRIAVPA